MLISIDVESSGPNPVKFDLVSVGCVVVDGKFDRTFFGEARPENKDFDPGAYRVIGVTREQHKAFAMSQKQLGVALYSWLKKLDSGNHTMVSDNPAFDFQFVSALFSYADLANPLGFSARRIGDYAAGLKGDWKQTQSWKHLRITKHTHNPVDDAKGNAEALWQLMGHKLDLDHVRREVTRNR
jgi:hypothetical protein